MNKSITQANQNDKHISPRQQRSSLIWKQKEQNQWSGWYIYEHITCIIEITASNSIAAKLWQLNNCQVLNFQGA